MASGTFMVKGKPLAQMKSDTDPNARVNKQLAIGKLKPVVNASKGIGKATGVKQAPKAAPMRRTGRGC